MTRGGVIAVVGDIARAASSIAREKDRRCGGILADGSQLKGVTSLTSKESNSYHRDAGGSASEEGPRGPRSSKTPMGSPARSSSQTSSKVAVCFPWSNFTPRKAHCSTSQETSSRVTSACLYGFLQSPPRLAHCAVSTVVTNAVNPWAGARIHDAPHWGGPPGS